MAGGAGDVESIESLGDEAFDHLFEYVERDSPVGGQGRGWPATPAREVHRHRRTDGMALGVEQLEEARGRGPRRAEQEQRAQQMLAYTAEIATQLDDFGTRIGEAAAQGSTAQNQLADSLATLAERLAASREALAGTDKTVLDLTDNSVRLLELIQASVTHASSDLPAAMSVGEAKLAELKGAATPADFV